MTAFRKKLTALTREELSFVLVHVLSLSRDGPTSCVLTVLLASQVSLVSCSAKLLI